MGRFLSIVLMYGYIVFSFCHCNFGYTDVAICDQVHDVDTVFHFW